MEKKVYVIKSESDDIRIFASLTDAINEYNKVSSNNVSCTTYIWCNDDNELPTLGDYDYIHSMIEDLPNEIFGRNGNLVIKLSLSRDDMCMDEMVTLEAYDLE